jgi:purine-binding chemotaxis protein CheW
MKEGSAVNINQYVVFKLSDNEYGISILGVNTIERMMPITRVPKTQRFIKGVVNLRGEIVPVMSLRGCLGIEEAEETDETRIVIVKVGEMQAGIIVDMVDEVIQLSEDSTESISNLTNDISKDFIFGVGKAEDRVITLLSTEKLLNAASVGII